jgi:hypothetical protein
MGHEHIRSERTIGGPRSGVVIRAVAVSIVVFAMVAIVSFLGVGAIGRVGLALALIGSAIACWVLSGRRFVALAPPLPEATLLSSWGAWAVGGGYAWSELNMNVAGLFLLFALVLVATSLIWSSVRWLRLTTLQALLSMIAGMISLLYFLDTIARI